MLRNVRTSQLTAEDWRVLGILLAALLIAAAGPVALRPSTPTSTPTSTTASAESAESAGSAGSTGSTGSGGETTAGRVIDLARAEIGTVEGRDGGTRYHRDYGLAANQPWCAAFVWDMFREAGGAASIGPKTAYTPTMADWFRSHGQWSATPTVGDLVFYNWPGDGIDRIQHIGIVESYNDSTITTIEANTSGTAAGSQDRGDGVYRRTRPRDSSVVGYGIPTYGLG